MISNLEQGQKIMPSKLDFKYRNQLAISLEVQYVSALHSLPQAAWVLSDVSSRRGLVVRNLGVRRRRRRLARPPRENEQVREK